MAGKTPYNYGDMFKMFDPEDVKKLFDPSKMFAGLDSSKSMPFDMTGVLDTNRKNFEAMVEANKSAAAAYKDLLEKQMEVFGEMTAAARDHLSQMDVATGPEAMSKQAQAYGEAVEKALSLMKKLAENAREANEEAYAALKDQIAEAMENVRKQAPKAK